MADKPTNLDMSQGATFSIQGTWTYQDGSTIDLSKYSARMHIRSSYASNTVVESLSTANGEITTTDTGDFSLQLPANRTANIFVDYTQLIKPPKTVYVYDLFFTDPTGFVTRLLFGTITVSGEVTRPGSA